MTKVVKILLFRALDYSQFHAKSRVFIHSHSEWVYESVYIRCDRFHGIFDGLFSFSNSFENLNFFHFLFQSETLIWPNRLDVISKIRKNGCDRQSSTLIAHLNNNDWRNVCKSRTQLVGLRYSCRLLWLAVDT